MGPHGVEVGRRLGPSQLAGDEPGGEAGLLLVGHQADRAEGFGTPTGQPHRPPVPAPERHPGPDDHVLRQRGERRPPLPEQGPSRQAGRRHRLIRIALRQLRRREQHAGLGDVRAAPAGLERVHRRPGRVARLTMQVGAQERPAPGHQVEADRGVQRHENCVRLVEVVERTRDVPRHRQREPDVVDDLGFQHPSAGLVRERDGHLEVADRLVDPAHEGQRDPPVVEHPGLVRRRQRTVERGRVALQCGVQPAQAGEQDAVLGRHQLGRLAAGEGRGLLDLVESGAGPAALEQAQGQGEASLRLPLGQAGPAGDRRGPARLAHGVLGPVERGAARGRGSGVRRSAPRRRAGAGRGAPGRPRRPPGGLPPGGPAGEGRDRGPPPWSGGPSGGW